MFRTILQNTFIRLVRPVWGKGLGNIPAVRWLYRSLYKFLIVRQDFAVDIQGNKMYILPSCFDAISPHLIFGTGYEVFETKFFNKLVKPGMCVVDIGANIGYYTLLAARLVGQKGTVYAFEPEPDNYEILIRNINANEFNNVVAVRKGIYKDTGKISFNIGEYSGAHSLFNPYSSIINTIEIETITLDDFFIDKSPVIDVIKIDVEGAEMTVLLGMHRMIHENQNIIIITEFYPPGLESSGYTPYQYYSKIREWGLQYIYAINEKQGKIEKCDFSDIMKLYEDISVRQPTAINLVCSKVPLDTELAMLQ